MAKLLGDGVLIVWVDLKEEARAEADRWYVQEHLPERVAYAGYLRSRRFQAVRASPMYMAVFEASTPMGSSHKASGQVQALAPVKRMAMPPTTRRSAICA